MKQEMNRRAFLGRSAQAAAGATLLAGARRARADQANDKIVMGVIGLGGRGRDLCRNFARIPGVEVAYVCDVDEQGRIGAFPDQMERQQNHPVKAVTDMRRIFDDKDVDAVTVATCDHWHALATIWACQAGKDVYVEKTPAINVFEGRKMVEAARKYQRIVQVGLQNRSAEYVWKARDYIQSGRLGDVHLVKIYNLKNGMPFKCPPDSETPPGVDYDMYLGPAPSRPFNRGHFHDGWLCFWAYSGGDMGGDGIHQIDIARMILGDPPHPKAVHGCGGNLAFQDDREVPDTQVVTFEYDRRVMTFELTQWAPYMIKVPPEVRDNDLFPVWPTCSTRIEVYGTRGLMQLARHGGGWQVITRGDGTIGAQEYGRQTTLEHQANFIDCVRSRALPHADIEAGHHSASLMCLGNLAVRLGGRRVIFDGLAEGISGDPEADALLTRPYREPYVVREQV